MLGSVPTITEGCRVTNGELHLTRDISTERVQVLSQKLYNMFADYEIPHWRVVGCSVRDNGRAVESVINKINGINMSYVELMQALSNVIISTRHGKFYTPDFGNNSESGVPSERFAHIMVRDYIGVVTTSNGVRYYGESSIPVQCLTRGEYLFDAIGKNVEVFAYLEYGTGMKDFSENNKVFKSSSSVVPCNTVYDLTSAVMVKPYTYGDKTVKFTYFKDVDETVLTEILEGVEVTA